MARNDNSISNEDLFMLLKEISAQNTEIRADVKQIKEEISTEKQKVAELSNKVEKLENRNKVLEQKLRATQRKIKKNNLIIFGIAEEENTNLEHVVIALLEEKLEISLQETDVNNTYRVGRKRIDKPRPVIIELVRNQKKHEILKNTTKLKGSGISITNDLIEEDVEEKKILYKHLKLAKEKQYNAKIYKNKLIVNGETYTSEQLESIALHEEDSNFNKPQSAPATPTSYVNYIEEQRKGKGNQEKIRQESEERAAESRDKGGRKEEQKSLKVISTLNSKASPTPFSSGPSINTRSGKKVQSDKPTVSSPANKT